MKRCPQFSRRQALGALALTCLGMPFIRRAGAQATGATLHFYTPEKLLNNFNTLKSEFDAYFATVGGHKFQPYGDRAAFEKAFATGNGVFLMSSWHYPRIAKNGQWQPTLIGQAQGRTTQRHVLCARETVANIPALKGLPIYAAGSEDYISELLADLTGSHYRIIAESKGVYPVPKDMDVLLNLGEFGAAQVAIVTESGLEAYAEINPTRHKSLKILAYGRERLRPVVVVPVKADAASDALIEVLKKMGESTKGKERLQLLGLDAFVPTKDSQVKQLKQ